MWAARGAFACLWVSQVARVLADNILRIFVVLVLFAQGGEAERGSAWHIVTALWILPFVALSPFNGAIVNSLPKRWVLTLAAAYCLAVLAVFWQLNDSWLLCWALVAIGSAIYSPTRYALLPAVAVDSHTPLTRVNALIEMGSTTAVVAGYGIGVWLYGATWHEGPVVIALVVGLSALGLLAALPAHFASDLRRPESPPQALLGFFRDARRIWADRPSRVALLGMALLRGLLTAMTGALLTMAVGEMTFSREVLSTFIDLALWVAVGVALGGLLAGSQRHPNRAMSFVPLGATGITVGLVLAALLGQPAGWLCLVLGMMGGLVNVPLAAKYQAMVPADARGNAMSVRNVADYLCIAIMAGVMVAVAYLGLPAAGQLLLIAVLAGLAATLAWRIYMRDVVEQILEVVTWPMYRLRSHGPGLEQIPPRGPLVLIVNHTAYIDPVWVGKVTPRPIIPMMTSYFFDKPSLRWLMASVFRAIRVESVGFRRNAPELSEAIRRLDQGECLVIFPEGRLRRNEKQPLRFFGRGAWHILHARPNVPVAVCWIEGGWGSYLSYKDGPPGVNKKLDRFRPIDIAVDVLEVLPPEVLADHLKTRKYLMQRCLAARRYLGLEPFTLPSLAEEATIEEEE